MPTLVNTYTDVSASASQDDLTTGTFTPVDGEILVVKLSTYSQNSTLGAPTGGSLTYTERVRYVPPDNNCFVAIYTAVVTGSPVNMSVSSVHSGNDSEHTLVVERWGSGASLSLTPVTIRVNATGAPSTSFTTTGPDSIISLLCADWNGVSGTVTYRGTSTQTYLLRDSGLFNSFNWYQAVATASTVTVGMTSPTGQKYELTGIEIKAATAVSQPIGLISETNNAYALARRKSRALGLASESNTVARLGRVQSLGLVSDTANAHVVGKGKTLAVGLATTLENAHSLIRVKSVVLGVGGSTDSVSRLGRVKSLGTAGDVTSLLVIGRVKTLALGHVTSTETALALGSARSRMLGTVGESSTAQVLSRAKAKTLGTPVSVETALSVLRGKRLGIGLVGGTETALNVDALKTRLLGLSAELNSAYELAKAKTRLLGLVESTDSALAMGGEIGLASDTSTVHSLRRSKSYVLGLASETSEVLTLGKSKKVSLGIVSDTNSLESLIRNKSNSLGIVSESTGANSWNRWKSKSLELLESLDTVHAMAGSTVHVDRTSPLTDSAALRMRTGNRYRRT